MEYLPVFLSMHDLARVLFAISILYWESICSSFILCLSVLRQWAVMGDLLGLVTMGPLCQEIFAWRLQLVLKAYS